MKAKAELRQRERKQLEIKEEHEKATDKIEPDNAAACRYYDKILKDKVFTPLQASIGNSDFDDRQRQNLCDLLVNT